MCQTPDSSKPISDSLFARARAGDQDAWYELVSECYPKVVRAVRHRLNKPMRSLYDSTDFANEVFQSLAAKQEQVDFPSFEALVQYLTLAAERKVIDGYRRHNSQKRRLDRNLRLADDDDGRPAELASPEPTPSKIAVANETREILAAYQGGSIREIVRLKEQQYTNEEVAKETGQHIRKVQRVLKGLGEALGFQGGRP